MPPIDPDYVEVAERIQEFYAKFPEGRLCTRSVDILEGGALAVAEAYRDADDPKPGIGTAWEPMPGKTAFTRDSEVQNAETSAWGRAIIAVGIPSKKIASAEEVRARQADTKLAARAKRKASPTPAAAPLTNEQKRIVIAASEASISDDLRHRITRMLTGHQSARDVADADCSRVAEGIRFFAEFPESALAQLEQWEEENGVVAA